MPNVNILLFLPGLLIILIFFLNVDFVKIFLSFKKNNCCLSKSFSSVPVNPVSMLVDYRNETTDSLHYMCPAVLQSAISLIFLETWQVHCFGVNHMNLILWLRIVKRGLTCKAISTVDLQLKSSNRSIRGTLPEISVQSCSH